jgi:hypothetical protein
MATTEEARETLIHLLTAPLDMETLAHAIVATEHLIAAAHAEGVAEGAEQERERIRFYSEAIYNTHLGVTAVKQWVVPDNILDPVLAPTKEKL